MNNIYGIDRRTFRATLDNLLHPSENIFSPHQLKGRDVPLRNMLDCLETPGAQAFIWGPRGVGKTSLGHTSCAKYPDLVEFSAAVSCNKTTTISQIMTDILRSTIRKNRLLIKDKKFTASLSAFGITLSSQTGDIKDKLKIESPSEAVALLNSIFSIDRYPYKTPVVIVDEFDLVQDKNTHADISNFLKQSSVEGNKVKFIFCGIAQNLDQLLGSHESVERYVYSIELQALSDDAIWEIIQDTEVEFGIKFSRGQTIRIGQISSGYAHFAHLILKNIILRAYESDFKETEIPEDLYRSGIHDSAEQAATRLKNAYDRAVKRGTDRYIEVLWATANQTHLDRQFKDIAQDYDSIMQNRPNRIGYDISKRNGLDLRNALNSLHKSGFLYKRKSGWYGFNDPMLRSYVRMIAEKEGIELGNESFHN
ncbi:MAG: AAA family ATPase [Cognatishimia sp.]|uniref:AAA family ATPase n=1 Tax=Cognatishimia sp. TaxID=2211648 RepID=UPI004058F74B